MILWPPTAIWQIHLVERAYISPPPRLLRLIKTEWFYLSSQKRSFCCPPCYTVHSYLQFINVRLPEVQYYLYSCIPTLSSWRELNIHPLFALFLFTSWQQFSSNLCKQFYLPLHSCFHASWRSSQQSCSIASSSDF